MPTESQVIAITPAQVDLVAPLFDAYRQFYGRASDLERARQFLRERLERAQSVILADVEDGMALGFVQLYPAFSSVALRPIWILNDLYVIEAARRKGVGARLLNAARDHALRSGAARLELATAVDNTAAQALYEKLGWRKDAGFLHFKLEVE